MGGGTRFLKELPSTTDLMANQNYFTESISDYTPHPLRRRETSHQHNIRPPPYSQNTGQASSGASQHEFSYQVAWYNRSDGLITNMQLLSPGLLYCLVTEITLHKKQPLDISVFVHTDPSVFKTIHYKCRDSLF